ncbi:MAG: hypothetical protein GC154_01105 [bacterium]|nr:hypothetical protein [bacterium]
MPTRRTTLKAGAAAISTFAIAGRAESKTYKAAIIGRMGGGDYGHGFDVVCTGLPNVEVVAVADQDESGGRKAQERSGARRLYRDYREMLDREKPDLVCIGPRQPDCHKDMALDAIERGVHIYMEKPITETVDEADAIVNAAKRSQVKVGVGHSRRFMPLFRQIKGLLDEGFLGTVLEMRVNGKQDQRAGGEDLIVLGTHDFDQMRWYFGDPSWCLAYVAVDGRDAVRDDAHRGQEPMIVAGDTIRSSFNFPHNVHTSWTSVTAPDHWNTNFSKREKWRFELYGTKRILAYQSGLEAAYWDSPFPAHYECEVQWKPLPEPQNAQVPDFEKHPIVNLIHAIETGGEPLCSAVDARWTIEMLSAVYQSHFSKGRINLPLVNRKNPLKSA